MTPTTVFSSPLHSNCPNFFYLHSPCLALLYSTLASALYLYTPHSPNAHTAQSTFSLPTLAQSPSSLHSHCPNFLYPPMHCPHLSTLTLSPFPLFTLAQSPSLVHSYCLHFSLSTLTQSPSSLHLHCSNFPYLPMYCPHIS